MDINKLTEMDGRACPRASKCKFIWLAFVWRVRAGWGGLKVGGGYCLIKIGHV